VQVDRADRLAGLVEQRDRRLALRRHVQHQPGPALRIVRISDRPSYQQFSIDDLMGLHAELQPLAPEQHATAIRHHEELGHLGRPRGYFGTRDGSARLALVWLDDAARP
jgi:hypothetical protein